MMRDDDMVSMLSQHTTQIPSIDLTVAVSTLEMFGEMVTALLPCEQRRRIGPEVEYAALAFLTYQFTPLRVDYGRTFRAAFEAAGMVMREASDVTRQRFLEEVILNCLHAEDVKRFSKVIRDTIAPERIGPLLRHHVAMGNDLHVYNSFWLLNYLRTSDEVIVAIAAQLVQRPTTNAHVREAATATLRFAAGTNVNR
jgi:hypothetical protein